MPPLTKNKTTIWVNLLIFLKTLFDSIVMSVLVGFVHENAR